METYLNLAHRAHRKSEFYCKTKQFLQAIYHHKIASEYLDKAIVQTHCDSIRTSLIIQRSHNLSQIEFLTRRVNYQYQNTVQANRQDSVRAGESPSDSTSTSNNHNSSTPTTNPTNRMALEEIEQKYQELYHVMKEQDSLIKCLVDKDAETNVGSLVGNRKPKEDKEIIEELQTVNDKLRQWISSLVDKLGKSGDEARNLREENDRLKREVATLKARPQPKDPIPELPPLEPPTLLY